MLVGQGTTTYLPDSAVRLFFPDHPHLANTLRAKLAALRAELIEAMATGYAQDFAEYKQRAGVINGIDQAIQLCLSTENDMRE